MKFYVMSEKKERGCPVGLSNSALYDKFYPDIKKVKHGYFPWYSESRRAASRTPFPQGMVLISKEKLFDFDIRSDSNFFYIASEEFLSLCKDFGLGVVDQAKIEVVSQSGKSISSKCYSAVLFEELDVVSNTDESSSFYVRSGLIGGFERLVLPAGWCKDIFKYKWLVGGSDTFICSEAFKDAAVYLKGIEYIPLEEVEWSKVSRI
ncbi:Imm43 family immunity protein [Pseudomonas sp. NPDC089734]|uniref:Imm43 family immunity protein n=1 Tax=Pseudomonas sp. NPDC089734 TaxID=3364469 RepID=UPI0037F627CE